MMKRNDRVLHITTVAPLLLFAIFASCVVIVLLFGAGNYQKLTRRDQDSYQRRTTVQYLTTRIRQSDAAGMVFVGDFYEATPKTSGDTVFIREVLGGRTFYTRIYCHDGYLWELFAEETATMEPADGERIFAVEQMRVVQDEDRLCFELAFANKEIANIWVTCRTGKETL